MRTKEQKIKHALYMRQYNAIPKNKKKKQLRNKKYYSIAKNIKNKKLKDKIYREKNKEKIKLMSKKWREKNKEKIAKNKKIYAKKNWNRILKYKRQWDLNKCKTDITYKIKKILRSRMYYALFKIKKSKSSEKLLGAPIQIVLKHLESKFKKGMSFKNHGKWHVDHIIPCSAFDLTKPEEQIKCFNYTNLQPLWAFENLTKSDKLNYGKD